MVTLKIFFMASVSCCLMAARGEETTDPDLKIRKIMMETLSLLDIYHAVVMVPQHYDPSPLVADLWLEGVTAEVHVIPRPQGFPVSNSNQTPETGLTSASTRDFLPPHVKWNFLYGRDHLPRFSIAVLLLGPADWVVPAAVQWDTLLLVATTGSVNNKVLCPHVPLAVRVAAIEMKQSKGKRNSCEGTVSEAQLMSGGKYSLQTVGCWKRGRLEFKQPLFPPLRSLKGATIKTAFVKGFNEINSVWRDNKQYLGGDLGKMLMMFKDLLDFNLDLMEVEGFGTRGNNGSFNGAIGFMERWDAEFASVSLSLLPERAEVIDYGEFFGIHNTRFITKVPNIMHDQFLLFQIYSWQVWCVIVFVMLIAAAVMVTVWGRSKGKTYHAISTVLKTAVYTTSEHLPPSTAGRLLHTCQWLVMIILVAVYSGNLTAFRSIPRVSNPPETIRELIDKGYILSISKGFSQYYKMKTSPVADQQHAFQQAKFRQDLGLIPDDEVIKEVVKKPVAMLVTVMATPIVIDNNAKQEGTTKVCTLKTGSEPLFLEIGALGFPRNSPIKYYFDRMIVWLRNTGHTPSYSPKCMKADLRRDSNNPLGLLEMGGVILMWAAGALLGIVCFVMEMVVAKIY